MYPPSRNTHQNYKIILKREKKTLKKWQNESKNDDFTVKLTQNQNKFFVFYLNMTLFIYYVRFFHFFLVIRKIMLNFAADKHNSITNKLIVARRNERNDNDNGQMPSGS